MIEGNATLKRSLRLKSGAIAFKTRLRGLIIAHVGGL